MYSGFILNFYAEISGDIAERIENAVYWTPGMTMAGFIEESMAKAIEELEEKKQFC